MKKLAMRYRIFLTSVLLSAGVFYSRPDVAEQSWLNSLHFAIQILAILPPILLIVGLMEAWVPVKTVEAYLGKESGAKGAFLASILGSIAAGPLFAAFPVAAALRTKGVRLANMVIFLGAWATLKVPILLMEIRFVGLRFSLLRLALTLPFIILIGFSMEGLLERRRPASR